MKFPNIKSLYGQVFAIFWLTQLLVLIGVLVAQNYDPRLQRDLHSKLKTELNQFSQQIAHALNAQTGTLGQKIESIERDNPNPYMRIYFTTPEGDLLPAKTNLPNRALKNFITLADDPSLPQNAFMAGACSPVLFSLNINPHHCISTSASRGDKPHRFTFKCLIAPFNFCW